MKAIYCLLFFIFTITPSFASSSSGDCDILIHGFSFKEISDDYFGDFPNQVTWDASEEIEVIAPQVANGILEKMNNCSAHAPVVLRPHSYGAAVVHYILGKGNLFQHAFPDHPFVQVYKKTTEVYAFTGGYQGTPLMDIVCANRLTRALIELLGTSCVRGLSTSEVDNVGTKVSSSGVPTYLIYSTNRKNYWGITGLLLAKHLVSFGDFKDGIRNQNDDTLPLYSTKACAHKKVMDSADSKCTKIDPLYMEDFYHTKEFGHLDFRKNHDFMYMKK